MDDTFFHKPGKGREEMCEAVENYAKNYAIDYAKEYAKEYAEKQRKSIALDMMQSDYPDTEIHRLLKLSYEDIANLHETADCLS